MGSGPKNDKFKLFEQLTIDISEYMNQHRTKSQFYSYSKEENVKLIDKDAKAKNITIWADIEVGRHEVEGSAKWPPIVTNAAVEAGSRSVLVK